MVLLSHAPNLQIKFADFYLSGRLLNLLVSCDHMCTDVKHKAKFCFSFLSSVISTVSHTDVHQRSAAITSCISRESALETLHLTVESFTITVESVPDLESALVCSILLISSVQFATIVTTSPYSVWIQYNAQK